MYDSHLKLGHIYTLHKKFGGICLSCISSGVVFSGYRFSEAQGWLLRARLIRIAVQPTLPSDNLCKPSTNSNVFGNVKQPVVEELDPGV